MKWETLARYGATLADKPAEVDPNTQPDAQAALDSLVANAVLRAYDSLVAVAVSTIPDVQAATLRPSFFSRVERLSADLPPTDPGERKDSFAEIMSAAWAYELMYGEEKERTKPNITSRFTEYEKTCRLVMKAVELIPNSDQSPVSLTTTTDEEVGAVLSRGHIATRVSLPVKHEKHLGLVPLSQKTLEAASVDVRLGNWFVALRRTRLPGLGIGQTQSEKLVSRVGREETLSPPAVLT